MAYRPVRDMLSKIEADHGQAPSEHKLVARNTLHYKIGDQEFWRLHETDVVVHDLRTGNWTLSTGGWKTLTTRDRINRFSPARVVQVSGLWYLESLTPEGHYDRENMVPYADGMVVGSGGKPVGSTKALVVAEAGQKRLLAMIDKFCRKALKIIKEKGKPVPDNGDCWDCLMEDKSGKSMGELGHSDHLLSHVKEGYVHGSLLWRAVKARGYGSPEHVFQIADAKWLVRDLRRYLKANLGLAR